MKPKLDSQIDELYKLPLDAFTKARNILAKSLSGHDKKSVASLVKPALAMWIVNQLYWQDTPTYKALIDASEKLRAAHRAALAGRKADTRKADEMHRTTLEKAFARASAIAHKQGVSLTDAARDAVRRTLAAVPTDEAPGRLTREPAPAGFSLLTGIAPRHIEPGSEKDAKKPDPRQQKLEEQRRKAAEAIARKAEERARKEEEKARKEKERRNREIQKAEEALRDAERRLAALKR
jgi:hypothetical protein